VQKRNCRQSLGIMWGSVMIDFGVEACSPVCRANTQPPTSLLKGTIVSVTSTNLTSRSTCQRNPHTTAGNHPNPQPTTDLFRFGHRNVEVGVAGDENVWVGHRRVLIVQPCIQRRVKVRVDDVTARNVGCLPWGTGACVGWNYVKRASGGVVHAPLAPCTRTARRPACGQRLRAAPARAGRAGVVEL
jgi:hypothetical protein